MRLLVVTQYFWPETFRVNDLVEGLVALVGPWKFFGRRYDAIFFWETFLITSALPAILLRRLKRAPLAMWVLDLWPETLSAVGVVRSQSVLNMVGWLVAFTYRRCDLILARSRASVANIEKWSGDTSRIRYFPGWAEPLLTVDPESVAPAPEMAALPRGFTVVFTGDIGETQDFLAILDAFERLRGRPDIRLVILGDGRAADHVRAEIVWRALGDTVVMLGKHPIERMPSFFRDADALLVSLKPDPIFAMTTPGKVQAYLASGIPLFGILDGEGARLIVESGAEFACAAGDGAGLARIVPRMVDLPESQCEAMGLSSRDYGRREFDRDTLIDRLCGWLEEAATASPAEKTR